MNTDTLDVVKYTRLARGIQNPAGHYPAGPYEDFYACDDVARALAAQSSAPAVAAQDRESLEKAASVLQQFKNDWMRVPNFAMRLNKEIRQAISMAISPIVNLDAVGGPLDLTRLPATTAPAQQDSDWTASGIDYDRAIHHNPDAEAWATLFVQTFPALADKHDLMRGWFANAMMAMYGHLKNGAQQDSERDAARWRAFRVSAAAAMSGLHSEALDAAVDKIVAMSAPAQSGSTK
jgi:hypothetical protein